MDFIFALCEQVVGFWACGVEERPCVGLAELHECLLCIDVSHFFLVPAVKAILHDRFQAWVWF